MSKSQGTEKRKYPLDIRTIWGLCTMNGTQVAAAAFISGIMLYLTDYSGMGAYAAVFATVLLAAGRVLDAVDDPIQGWLIDRAKPGKHGKYRKFMLFGIAVLAVGIIMLFSMPLFGGNLILQIIWVSVAYVLYEIGYSMQPVDAIRYSLTTDTGIRAKHLMYIAIAGTLISTPLGLSISFIISLGDKGMNIKTAYAVVISGIMLFMMILSYIGTFCVKEGRFDNQEKEETVTVKDIFQMLKVNKPLWISFFAELIGGMAWYFISGAIVYYLKWAYGTENFAVNTMIWGLLQLAFLLVGICTGPLLLKKLEPKHVNICAYSMQLISFLLIYICFKLDVLSSSLFFIFAVIYLIGNGIANATTKMITMETMDYGLYITGKNTTASNQALHNFIGKAQAAIGGVVVGAVLIAVGYVVDEAGEYIGTLPVGEMLNGLMVVIALIPIALALGAIVAYAFYPIQGEKRKAMYDELERRKSEQKEERKA